MISRRKFIQGASTAAVVLPAILGGFSARAIGVSPFLQSIADTGSTNTDHVLVLIRLEGGNDGLNTVVPIDKYAAYANARQSVAIPQNALIKLTGADNIGLHPSMPGMASLYNEGKVKIVHSVGYANPNFSHFRATDIWHSGSDSDQLVTSGWAGRYLNYEYPNFPSGYPNATAPHPLAIEIGSSTSLALLGPQSEMGYAITDIKSFYSLVEGVQTPAPNTFAGDQLKYVRQVYQQSRQYGKIIIDAAQKSNNAGAYDDNNNLAQALKIVARLIAGGLKTRVYVVGLGSFDSHVNQVVATDHTQGAHATLLKTLSEGVKSFMDDLKALKLDDRVMGMTFSEFGRRIISNNGLGTDHGAAEPMFVFGKAVNGGQLGKTPDIPANAGENDNVPMQYDFRSMYATVLQDWLCVPTGDLNQILLKNFQTLPLVKSVNCLSTDVHDANVAAGTSLIRVSPNPFTQLVNLDFESAGGHTMVQIFNTAGQLVATPVNTSYPAGAYQVYWNSENLPAGTYYARLQNGALQQVKMMMKVR